MKKKLLFIAPDYYGFNEVIFEGLNNYTEYECQMVISAKTKKYEYKNLFEKLENFLSKTFFNKNLKDQRKRDIIVKEINRHNYYDIILVNRPDILDEGLFNLLESKGGKKIVVFWDSFAKIKDQEKTLCHFDIKYSFDIDDCEKYNLKKINNFYFNEELNDIDPKYEVIYLGTYDKRFTDLEKIIKYLNEKGISNTSFIYHPKDFELKDDFVENIIKLPSIIPFKESFKISNFGKIILDLAHDNQSGLSFRPFESLGNRKKLITTNKFIKKYDFYNPNNIFVIEDIENIIIPSSFFESPYVELSDEIYEKYSFNNWIKTITTI